MGGLDKWLDEQLQSPVGQLIFLSLAALIRLAFHFSGKRRKKKNPKRRPSGQSS